MARTFRDDVTRQAAGVLLDGIMHAGLQYGQVDLLDWNDRRRRYVGRTSADGPSVRLAVSDPKVVLSCAANASLAVGEAYMGGTLVIGEKELFSFFELIAKNAPRTARRQLYRGSSNAQQNQARNIAYHYDLGNDYYGLFLGATMLYSCAYFARSDMSLDEAQHAKVDHIVAKLRLDRMRPNGRVLDVGSGWGHLAVEIAKRAPKARVVGITLSDQQLEYARRLAEREEVAERVEFRKLGYQDVDEQFDRIVSVGMFEHVGKKDYGLFFRVMHRALADDGVFVLHTITQQDPARRVDAWTDRYIFPGGNLPTKAQIALSSEPAGWYSEETEDLAPHYARTLELWWENHAQHKAGIIEMADAFKMEKMTGEEFYRMRTLWLIGSWAGFRHGKLGLTQLVLSKTKTGELRTRAHQYR
ncbi:MAG TPA: class I SAM-dependent methyltransferase [Candidatus Saccharimonadales bacterium]|nr:class I SAM-dependent methyltransferase [Candidatus Saccharimonadales bacterium]